jgi:hypothetical protein
MHRLIAPGSVPFANRDIAPASGTPQYATDGVPGVTAATQWPAYAYNAIQDEILACILAAGLTPDKDNWAQLLAALRKQTNPADRVAEFLANGSFTTDAYTASVLLTGTAGGGGGGGGAASTGGNLFSGGGGGAGDYVFRRRVVVAPSTTYAVTIGAAGAPGIATTSTSVAATNGSSGGVTSFGAILSLAGGLGAAGGSVIAGVGTAGGGAAGGTGTGIGGDPGRAGSGSTSPQVTNGAFHGGSGGRSMFGRLGAGGPGGDAGYSSGTTPSPFNGVAGGAGYLFVEW